MQSLAQHNYHKKRCKYCNGTGNDTLNHEEACPNCCGEVVVLKQKEIEEMNIDKLKVEENEVVE